MKISQSGIDLLKQFEGISLDAYQEAGVEKLVWIYSLRNSGTEVHRMLII